MRVTVCVHQSHAVKTRSHKIAPIKMQEFNCEVGIGWDGQHFPSPVSLSVNLAAATPRRCSWMLLKVAERRLLLSQTSWTLEREAWAECIQHWISKRRTTARKTVHIPEPHCNVANANKQTHSKIPSTDQS